MTVMTKEQIEAWLRGEPGILEAKSQMEKHAPDLARTALALHQQLADAQAAAALVVELCADEFATHPAISAHFYADTPDQWRWRVYEHIMSLADPSGVEALAALRADHASRELEWATIRDELVAERDALAAKLAAAEARVVALTEERDEAVDLAEERLRGQHRLSNQLNNTARELNARIAALQEALEFYANKEAWSQPPVRTREGLLSIEYENQASKVQRDRGKIARAALNMEAANG